MIFCDHYAYGKCAAKWAQMGQEKYVNAGKLRCGCGYKYSDESLGRASREGCQVRVILGLAGKEGWAGRAFFPWDRGGFREGESDSHHTQYNAAYTTSQQSEHPTKYQSRSLSGDQLGLLAQNPRPSGGNPCVSILETISLRHHGSICCHLLTHAYSRVVDYSKLTNSTTSNIREMGAAPQISGCELPVHRRQAPCSPSRRHHQHVHEPVDNNGHGWRRFAEPKDIHHHLRWTEFWWTSD